MTATTTPQVQAYAAAVRAALADVPAAEAAGLLDGLEPHLEEVAAEGGASLVDALGPPDRYAAELRTSAGLHTPAAIAASLPATGPPAPPLPPRRDLTAEPLVPSPAEPSPRSGLRAGLRSHRVVLHVGPPARRWWGTVVLAAVVVGVLVAVLQSEPLSLGDVVLRAAAIAAGWTIAAAVVSRGVPDRWRDPARVVLVVAAVATALVVGANAGDDQSDDAAVVYSDLNAVATTGAAQYVPSVVGLSVDDATAQLAAFGLSTQFNGFPDGGRAIIAEQIPPAGSTIPLDWTVTLLTRDQVAPTTLLPGDPPGATGSTPTEPPETATTVAGVITTAPAIDVTTTSTTTPLAPPG